MITDEYIKNLTPVELEYIKALIYKLVEDKVTNETTNNENLKRNIEECPYCGSKHFVKNGSNKNHKQKYRCKECGKTFSDTTKTMFYHTKSNYNTWKNFIGCEINGLSLAEEAIVIGKTKTTCYNMRHKLYKSIEKEITRTELSGEIELDSMYTKINLKGTRPEKMPRMSKKRGGKFAYPTGSKKLKGLSHHKICIVTAVDENDNMLIKIAGLGAESKEYYNKFVTQFTKESTIISDSKPAIINFAKENGMSTDTIPVVSNGKRYTTKKGNSLASLSQIQSEFKSIIKKKHGISTRHLQDYLNWFIFCKFLKYRVKDTARSTKSYLKAMSGRIQFSSKDISSFEMPISLYQAYGEYEYGIFSHLIS